MVAQYVITNKAQTEAQAVQAFNLLRQVPGVRELIGYRNVTINEQFDSENKSVFGLPVFMPLEIDAVKWKEGNQRKATEGIYVPCTVVEVAGEKMIAKTTIQNQRVKGTVKEYYAQGDYQVSIKGILSNDDNTYPMLLVKTIKEIFEAPAAIEVTHQLLNEIGIYNLVLEGIRWLPTNGYVNLQPFEIRGVSDNPIELQLKDREDLKPV